MPRFAYSAYDASGASVTGEVQALDDVAALDQLSARGLTPVSLTAGGAALPWWQRDLSLTGSDRLKPQAQELFFRSLASLLSVGFPLPRALRFCAETTRDRAMARVLAQATDALDDGQTLADALRDTTPRLPDRLLTMIEIGEASNRLAPVATRIAETLEAEASRRRSLRAALVYPVILMGMAVLVMALLVFYLAPTLVPVFGTSGATPPAILTTMLGLRDLIVSRWPVLLAALSALTLALRLCWPALQRLLAPLALRLPVIGPYRRQAETLALCRTLSMMLSSGAPLPRALATARDTARHPAYKELLARTQDTVASGAPLSANLSHNPLIDPMAGAMLEAAEEADRMGPILDRLVADLSERTERTLDQALKLVTPLLTLVIGVSVGGVILATISAILTLNDVSF